MNLYEPLLASERSERASLLSCKLRFAIYIYIYIFSYVRQNFDLRMLSFTRIARGNFRTLYTGILPVTITLRSTATVMFGATVSTPLPLLLEVPLRLRLGLRLVPRYRYCLEFRALRLGSLLGLGLPVTAKARSRAIYIIAVLPIIEYRI